MRPEVFSKPFWTRLIHTPIFLNANFNTNLSSLFHLPIIWFPRHFHNSFYDDNWTYIWRKLEGSFTCLLYCTCVLCERSHKVISKIKEVKNNLHSFLFGICTNMTQVSYSGSTDILVLEKRRSRKWYCTATLHCCLISSTLINCLMTSFLWRITPQRYVALCWSKY